jgi:hypothetical protein
LQILGKDVRISNCDKINMDQGYIKSEKNIVIDRVEPRLVINGGDALLGRLKNKMEED